MMGRAAMILAPGLLAAALWALTADGLELPWLLLGTHLRADDTGRVFLVLAAIVWTAAAVAAGPTLRDPTVRRRRLLTFASAAMVGNLGLAVAQDAISFFTLFSVMSLAAYGLVAARADRPGLRAGRIYIGMAVMAEAALLAGLVMAVRSAGSIELQAIRATLADAEANGVVIALLLVGLGVKAGVLGLHMWLPLAYAAAPLPAGAILAGALTELGLLGWLRVLPIGEASLGGWGVALVLLGGAGVVYGVLVGATQTAPNAVLAYSSIGQIGLMAAGIGVALARPDLAPAAVAAVLLFALHHGIVKGTLFIGLGVASAAHRGLPRVLALGSLALLALMLAGAPLTSGAAAKEALKAPAQEWWSLVEPALALSVVATTILMGRMLLLIADRGHPREPLAGAGPALGLVIGLAGAAAVPVAAAAWAPFADAAGPYAPTPSGLWAGLWPVALGAAIALGLDRLTRARPGVHPRIPAGDVVIAAEHLGERAQVLSVALARRAERFVIGGRRAAARLSPGRLLRAIEGAEARIGGLAAGTLALLALALLLLAALSGAGGGG